MIEVILHHSLTKDSGTKSFDAIKKYHMQTHGWKNIGYQYVIELINNSYATFKGRGESEVGAHTEGHNTKTIGVCLVGNFDETVPSEGILNELYELLDDIASRYGGIKVSGHHDYATKSCPGKLFPLSKIKEMYKTGYRVKPKPQPTLPAYLTLTLNDINYPVYDYKNIDGKYYVGLRDLLVQLGYKSITGDVANVSVKATK